MRAKGNTLVEYGLVASLSIVVLGGLIYIGNAMKDSLLGFKSDMQKNITASKTVNEAIAAARNSDILGDDSTPLGSGGGKACTNNNICFTIPATVTKSAITLGSNGVTESAKASTALLELAKALSQDPNADPSLVALVTKLANQGHALAQAQKNIYCSSPGYCSSKGNREKGMNDLSSGLSDFKSQLGDLDKLLNTTKAGMNANLLKVIDQESGTIIGISNNFHLSGNNWSYSAAGFGIAQTHLSSNHICKSGGNTGQCVQ